MFIVNVPAMKLENYLIIADLHIGITQEMISRGIKMPNQAPKLSSRLNSLKRLTGTKKLIILGDVKHNIPVIHFQEYRELPEFFSGLEFEKTIILKGNHDGRIEKIVGGHPEVKVKKTFSFKNYAFTHGHRRIKTSKKIIVIGHNQPHVKFRDKIGATYTEPVWIKGPLNGQYKGKKLIIVPAYNELAGATIVNRDRLLGPIAKSLDNSKAHCYLLDGTDIGPISDLSIKG